MIISTNELQNYVGRVTMVDGSFDPLHDGHIAYFSEAKKLGNPVLCNIASDEWTKSKHAVLLGAPQRAVVIDAIKFVDFVHVSTGSTASVLAELRPLAYAKGSDWKARGGVPKEELEICKKHNIQVVYLETVFNSSSEILKKFSSELGK
ncbi:MAG: adenylyltransferase/cytidyltransferase family protein [Ilumatobacteraceae bacterium]|jgi:cytidyltransferase-like protein